MKKIIDNKLYNTDTAAKVGCWWNISNPSDFHFCSETLYRKKTGEYFLHGEGNAMSRYAKTVDTNTWTSGERIMPLDYDEARMWAEKNLDPEDYEAEFGEVAEDDTTTVISISLPADVVAKGRRRAQETGAKSLSAFIASLILNS